jgi:PncC family amidohydrolase
VDDTGPEARLHANLLARGMTVATAESLTGGLLGGRLTATAGSSATYVGGVVAYATELKQRVLGVRAETLSTYGVVSAECAREMAAGARDLLGSDWALSTTGVAGPTRQEDRPPGTVFVGVAGPTGVRTLALRMPGERDEVRAATCDAAVAALLEDLHGSPA